MPQSAVRSLFFNISLQGAEAPLPLAVGEQRLVNLLIIKVGPEDLGEIVFAVGGLPDQEIADAELAAGADDQVNIG